MREVSEFIHTLTDSDVYVVKLDENPVLDVRDSYFGTVWEQVDGVCAELAAIPELHHGFNALGVSQGGLFLRALQQSCSSVRIHNLVTLGSPHMGVQSIPTCSPTNIFCRTAVRFLLRLGFWDAWVQKRFVQAQYYREETAYDKYLENNIFLPYVNNELPHNRSSMFSSRLQKLNKLVLVGFGDDRLIEPRSSSLFGWVNETTGELVPMREQPLYKSNALGLRTLDESGKVDELIFPGNHLHLSKSDFAKLILTYFRRNSDDTVDSKDRPNSYKHVKRAPWASKKLHDSKAAQQLKEFAQKKQKAENAPSEAAPITTVEELDDLTNPFVNVSRKLRTTAASAFVTVFSHFFYEINDVYHSLLELFSLIPQIIGIVYLSVLFTNREMDTLMQFAGQVGNEMFNYILKITIREPRQHGFGMGYGMPSSHSQFMGYFFAYMCTWCIIYRREQLKSLVTIAKMNLWALLCTCVCASRYLLGFHTAKQVAVGFFAGAIVGTVWCIIVSILRVFDVLYLLLEWKLLQMFSFKDTIPWSVNTHHRLWLDSRSPNKDD
ncbi:palmitoyl protein thioesterase-dolichol pyrophosphate phosphatase fusion 1 [Schizosaccharomyces japonicus yFS275]|uniref:Palmitoyl protein thioesterase-dolichol pyrophosphate phosphatase fusion 1 n=1 Tax=Schizosaccharomyces japonicus (strain yFS275 / FY16936) TaxID=402676 RepID=B6JZL3_SCHJY|nr:palmitoyl protein thioesterase-dolichol pyrophosphate phosphatase fusion 1 [Schizosaccharomyces japonicus yFS275]EEB06981.1 palmitoyl protein thioesterase-dolichol pyrophosphate phosphatase fusion 1 [Schizosaccharomyces japonicus yFS275]